MSGSDLPWARAREAAARAASALPPVLLPLEVCAGQALAAPLLSATDLPPFDTAAMDGYAVAADGPWRVVGEVLAGSEWAGTLAPGTAVAVGTGAATPRGADAVLQVEHAQVRGDVVSGAVEGGRHVRRAGEECRRGERLLDAGTVVSAAVLGLAAAAGHDALQVVPRPRVAALVTGDELLTEGVPRGGRVRDALGPQLPALVAAHGGELVARSHLPDEKSLLRKAIETSQADVVVTTGASSLGRADHLREVLDELRARRLVDGVAVRPGHPQLLAALPDGRFVVGLPGNPLAALAAAATVLAPLLAALGGRRRAFRAALLAEPLRGWSGGTRLVPVALDGLHARPVPHAGAGMLRGASLAGALAVVPAGAGLPAGAQVEVLPLP